MMGLGFTEVLLLIVVVMFFLGRHRLESYLKRGGGFLVNRGGETDSPLGKQFPQKEPEGIDVSSGEQPLIVFVSSRMDELWQERQSVNKAIKQLPLTKPWLFEFTPPSTEAVDEAYLGKVEQCDVFILILGESISAPVLSEFRRAKLHQKPCLVFLKNCQRSEDAEAFVNDLALKWPMFSTPSELAYLVRLALVDELIRGYREGRQKKLSNEHMAVLLLIQGVLTDMRTDLVKLAPNRPIEVKIDGPSIATYLELSPLVEEVCEIAGRSGYWVPKYSMEDRLRGIAQAEENKSVGADGSGVSRLVRACHMTGLKTINDLDAALMAARRYAGEYLLAFAYLYSGKSRDFLSNENKHVGLSAAVLVAMLLIAFHRQSLSTHQVSKELYWPITDVKCIFEASKNVMGSKVLNAPAPNNSFNRTRN